MNDETKILLKEYEILVDRIGHDHTRRHDLNRVSLVVNAILMAACTAVIQLTSTSVPAFDVFIVLCSVGMIYSVVWLLISQRITINSELWYCLLRYIERRLGREPGIFTFGRKLFKEKHTKGKKLKPPDGRGSLRFPKWYQGFRAVWSGWLLPILFIGAYVFLLGIVIYYNWPFTPLKIPHDLCVDHFL